MSFVLSLEKGMYMYQFGQYAWTHMICFLIVVPSSFFVSNIFECGILWLLLPAFVIILNDIMAYFFGFYFGKTPLIKLSPKKTWEGFMGALVSTVFISFYFAKFLSKFQWMICPRTDLSIRGWLECGVRSLLRHMASPISVMLGTIPLCPSLDEALTYIHTHTDPRPV